MAQYIDKDAVVAEIAKRVKESEIVLRDCPSSAIFGLAQAYKNVLSFLDTLEVKEVVQEVDLDAAVERYIGQHKGELRGYFDIRRIARHFFELGRFVSYVSIKTKKGK